MQSDYGASDFAQIMGCNWSPGNKKSNSLSTMPNREQGLPET